MKQVEQAKAETEQKEEVSAKPSNKSKKLKKKKKGAAKSKTADTRTAVIYVGHIPYGFFENEMREFFSQFGQVTRVRVSRTRDVSLFDYLISCCFSHIATHLRILCLRLPPSLHLTSLFLLLLFLLQGKSRHYAFVEFADEDVAQVAAETMDNYMMFGKTLVCKSVQCLCLVSSLPCRIHLHPFFYPVHFAVQSQSNYSLLCFLKLFLLSFSVSSLTCVAFSSFRRSLSPRRVVPKDQVHPQTFRGTDRPFVKPVPFKKIAKAMHNKVR